MPALLADGRVAGGRAHTAAVLPWVADPVLVRGRLVRTGDVMKSRAGLADIRRL